MISMKKSLICAFIVLGVVFVVSASVVSEKLEKCDFIVNPKFKKSAKAYIVLYSASWCPPCRQEMPRIAELYKRHIRRDPDLELIQVSQDDNLEKARNWANDLDVKFPVVKKSSAPFGDFDGGIPHVIVYLDDGSRAVSEHPGFILHQEWLDCLKSGVTEVSEGGYTWKLRIHKGEATIFGYTSKSSFYVTAISPEPIGALKIPETLGGAKVTAIGPRAFSQCKKLTEVDIPAGIKLIGDSAFRSCSELKTVRFHHLDQLPKVNAAFNGEQTISFHAPAKMRRKSKTFNGQKVIYDLK